MRDRSDARLTWEGIGWFMIALGWSLLALLLAVAPGPLFERSAVRADEAMERAEACLERREVKPRARVR